MRAATIFAAFAAVASAAPNEHYQYGHCLTDHDAKELVYATTEIFASNDPKDLVLKYFTKNYHQYTDSTNIILPEVAPPLGEPFTTSRKQFLQQHTGFNPNNPGYDVEDYFHDCTKIVFRFVSRIEGTTNIPVRGIEVLETVWTPHGWRIKTDYSEFNNVALLYNYGFCIGGPCPGSEEGGSGDA